jgi:hypothetical protein
VQLLVELVGKAMALDNLEVQVAVAQAVGSLIVQT